MDTTDLEDVAQRYKEASEALDAVRTEMQATAVALLREGVKQADVARLTGWSREHLRRLKEKAEVEELRQQVEELSAAKKPRAAASAPRQQVTQTVPEPKRPPRGWRGTPMQIRNLADLARERADSGQLAQLDQAAKAQSEEGKQDHAVLREAYDMGVLTDDDLYAEQPDATEETSA